MPERCYRCGRVKCETCEGKRWLEAERTTDCRQDRAMGFAPGPTTGRDPSVLCPKCQHAQDEADAHLGPEKGVDAQDVRDAIKEALAQETLDDEAERN
jgi:hypothetical protein